jgi:hypothetical protein
VTENRSSLDAGAEEQIVFIMVTRNQCEKRSQNLLSRWACESSCSAQPSNLVRGKRPGLASVVIPTLVSHARL